MVIVYRGAMDDLQASKTSAFSTTYDYQKLKYSDSFRVIELLPGEDTAPLQCRLVEVRRSSNPDFQALSYTWGVVDYTQQIHEMNTNTSFAITENLWDALRALRHPDKTRTIFIDAICIHQASTTERGQQVAQMGDIYRSAKLVVAWLGKDDHELAIQSLQHMADNSIHCGIQSVFPISNQAPSQSELSALARVVKECDLAALSSFFTKSWFERVWILQELVLAREVVFFSGRFTITYEDFSRAMAVVTMLFTQITLNAYDDVESLQALFGSGIDFGRIKGTLQIREQRLFTDRLRANEELTPLEKAYLKHYREIPLAVYCVTLNQYKCHDARDRVYGMLGLAQNGLHMSPDYNNSPEQIFKDMALTSLVSGDLSVLHHGGIPWVNEAIKMPRMPTFAADLENLNSAHPHLGGIGTPRYHAASQVVPRVNLVTSGSTKLPSICGRVISTVDDTTYIGQKDTFLADYTDQDVSKFPPQFTIALGALHDVYDFCKELSLKKGTVYAEGFDLAFARTIVLDNVIPEVSWLANRGIVKEDLLHFLRIHKMVYNRPAVRHMKYMLLDDERQVLLENTYKDGKPLTEEHLEATMQQLRAYHNVVRGILSRRTVFVTPQGHVGLGPNSMLKSDIVAVFEGGETPFILRPVKTTTAVQGSAYHVVGECYLHGWMNGEALSDEAAIPAEQLILM